MELLSRVAPNVVKVALALMQADGATVQVYDLERNGLRLLTHHGLDAVNDWEWVNDMCSIDECLRSGQRVIVCPSNIGSCNHLIPEPLRRWGMRAMQCTPL